MLLPLLLLPLLLQDGADAKTDPKLFTSKEQLFSVRFSKTPAEQKVNDKGPDQQDVSITIIRANADGISYIVATSVYSDDYLKQPTKQIFDSSRNGSIQRSGGKLLEESEIKLGNIPGRAIFVEAGRKAGVVRSRVFVSNDRQYAVMIAAKTKDETTSDAANRFMDSFKVHKGMP